MTVEFGIAMALPKSNNPPTGLYSSDLELCLQSSSMDAFMSEINTFTGDNTFLMEPELTDIGPLSSSCSIGDRYNSYDFTVPSHDLLEVSSLLYLDGDVLCHNSDLVDGTFAQHWGGSLWGSQESDFFKMDDVFQVDKDEVVQGPTLAELNANESLLDTLDFKIVLPEEDSFFPKDIQKNVFKSSQIPTAGSKVSSTVTATKCKDPVLSSSAFPSYFCSNGKFSLLSDKNVMNKEVVVKEEPVDSKVTLQNLLLQNNPEKDYKPIEVPKIEVDADRKWEVQSHVSEDSQKDETSSLTASSGVFSPKEELDSHDEGFDSNPDDSDQEDSSDDDSILSADEYSEAFPKKDKKDRYFWQYNLQSKGPKKRRSVIPSRRTDPHNLRQPSDPVFHPQLQLKGVRHGGKARRGDGNDLTPNPRKLYQIGLELKKLNKIINDLTPVSEMPFNVRSKSRKEKNKLASRACRLKKKAQHEANKLKLFGLDQEHSKLSFVLSEIKLLVSERCRNHVKVHSDTLTHKLDKLIRNNLGPMIAGHTAEFVNSVLDKVAAGHPTGGVEF